MVSLSNPSFFCFFAFLRGKYWLFSLRNQRNQRLNWRLLVSCYFSCLFAFIRVHSRLNFFVPFEPFCGHPAFNLCVSRLFLCGSNRLFQFINHHLSIINQKTFVFLFFFVVNNGCFNLCNPRNPRLNPFVPFCGDGCFYISCLSCNPV